MNRLERCHDGKPGSSGICDIHQRESQASSIAIEAWHSHIDDLQGLEAARHSRLRLNSVTTEPDAANLGAGVQQTDPCSMAPCVGGPWNGVCWYSRGVTGGTGAQEGIWLQRKRQGLSTTAH
eukprot:TRINITY_DN59538_c0_g1_i1.p4 TRINITY_DN59538_c0_g1~~TRINITY_DN59538_c0_g1_i1.p4  ORF type:complete len:122 (+),score=5.99 TRINITY_DN59538_c0_g1_i1:221-586(+)